MYVYSGKCNGLTCVDHEGGNGALCEDIKEPVKSATVNFKTQDGVDYYILVTGRRGKVGNFGVKVTEIDTTPNNECENGEPLDLDGWEDNVVAVEGSTLQATADFSSTDDVCGVPLNSPFVPTLPSTPPSASSRDRRAPNWNA